MNPICFQKEYKDIPINLYATNIASVMSAPVGEVTCEYSRQPELLKVLREAIEKNGELVLNVASGHFLYAAVPSSIVEIIRAVLANHFGKDDARFMRASAALDAGLHVTLAYPSFDSDTKLPAGDLLKSAELLGEDIAVSAASSKKERAAAVQKLFGAYKAKFPTIQCDVGDLLIATNDGNLGALEIIVTESAYPHLPGKIYHLTLWSDRGHPQRAPAMSNVFLQDAKAATH